MEKTFKNRLEALITRTADRAILTGGRRCNWKYKGHQILIETVVTVTGPNVYRGKGTVTHLYLDGKRIGRQKLIEKFS